MSALPTPLSKWTSTCWTSWFVDKGVLLGLPTQNYSAATIGTCSFSTDQAVGIFTYIFVHMALYLTLLLLAVDPVFRKQD